jgi:hypothetical protein
VKRHIPDIIPVQVLFKFFDNDGSAFSADKFAFALGELSLEMNIAESAPEGTAPAGDNLQIVAKTSVFIKQGFVGKRQSI